MEAHGVRDPELAHVGDGALLLELVEQREHAGLPRVRERAQLVLDELLALTAREALDPAGEVGVGHALGQRRVDVKRLGGRRGGEGLAKLRNQLRLRRGSGVGLRGLGDEGEGE